MSLAEPNDEPSPEQAAAGLQALAAAFLGAAAAAGPDSSRPTATPAGAARPAIVVVDERGLVHSADPEAEALWGASRADLVDRPVDSLIEMEPAPEGHPVAAMVLASAGGRLPVVLTRHVLPLNEDRALSFLLLRRGEPEANVGSRSELRYRNLVEQIPAVVFTAALDGGLYDIYVGPQIEGLLGYTQQEWLRSPVLWYERLHPEDRRVLDLEFARGCATGGPFRADCRFIAADGRVVWVHGEARLIKDAGGVPLFLQGVAFDISEAKRAEELVRASLREKEVLLKEIHHRVKNNLQITSSLLRLQVAKVADEGVRQTLRESQDRIRSIALVHEMLYRSSDLSRVSVVEYARSLVLQLFRSYSVDSRRIGVVFDLGEVELDVDVAVPCGLILNELVVNALKHAFPEGRKGTIEVRMKADAGFYQLSVRDDGVGIPSGLDVQRVDSLGLRLVRTLSDQLDGRLHIQSDRGMELTVTFPSAQEPR